MLSRGERAVLKRKGIHTGYKFRGEYRIYLEWKNGYRDVRFRIEERTDGKFEFIQSHFIKTPEQATPYRTNGSSADSMEEALQSGVETFMSYFNRAVKKHKPNKSWFVPNDEF